MNTNLCVEMSARPLFLCLFEKLRPESGCLNEAAETNVAPLSAEASLSHNRGTGGNGVPYFL